MEILQNILLFLHLIGMAIIVGGYFANIRRPLVSPGMLHGSYLQLLTGVLLVGVAEMGAGGELDYVKITIKIVLALIVAVLAFIGRRKEKAAVAAGGTGESDPHPSAFLSHLTVSAAVLAVIVAVFV